MERCFESTTHVVVLLVSIPTIPSLADFSTRRSALAQPVHPAGRLHNNWQSDGRRISEQICSWSGEVPAIRVWKSIYAFALRGSGLILHCYQERKEGREKRGWVCGSCESHRVAGWTRKVSHGNWEMHSVGFNLVSLRTAVSLLSSSSSHPRSSYRMHRRCGQSFLGNDCVQWLWSFHCHTAWKNNLNTNLTCTDEMWMDLKHQ